MIPLKDNIPTNRFPIVTVLLIVLNIGVFIWQQTTPSDKYSSDDFQRLGVGQRDQETFEYGAIPYRLTHPGKTCAVGAVSQTEAGVVCEDTLNFTKAKDFETQGAPFAPLKDVPFWLTILFAMFMHAGLLHIAGNMLFLWVFGNNIEDSMGRGRFVLFYLLAGLVAIYAQSVVSPDSTVPTIGASGAVAGVVGAYLLLHPRARVLTLVVLIFFITVIEIPAMILLAIWFALQFIPAVTSLGDVGSGGVAYLAHVGGFLFGLATIRLFIASRRSDASLPPPTSTPPPGYA